MCMTCSTCPFFTSLRPAWDKEAMEDRYYASMQRQQHMRYEDEESMTYCTKSFGMQYSMSYADPVLKMQKHFLSALGILVI
jgi:hypothetical protein